MRSPGGIKRGPPPGRYSNDEVDYLLSDGGLAGSQQAEIFEAVERTLRGTERRKRIHHLLLGGRWARSIGAVLAVTAACIVFWTWKGAGPASFRRKGAATTPATATVDVECLRATLDACPRGSILAFSVGGADPGRFMTAYLTSSKDPRPIWLFLNEPTSSRAAGGGDLLARGARLPDAIDIGSYTIQVTVTSRPQSRDQVIGPLSAEMVARARFAVVVLP